MSGFQAQRKLATMFGCTNQVSFQSKMLSNRAEVRKEALWSSQISQATHAALPLSGRLMAIFGAVIHACGSPYEDVLRLGKRGHSGFGNRIATKLICHDDARCRAVAQKPLEELFGCGSISMLLQ